MFQSPRNTV